MISCFRFSAIRFALFCALVTLGVAACGDGLTEPPPSQGDVVGVVLSSADRALTVFAVDTPAATSTIGLAPDGSPVTMAVRGAKVAVPLGTVPAVVVVDLAAGAVAHTVPLPEGSGATGAAFLNDSIAVVANPNRNSVSLVNVRSGALGDEISVGTFPQAAAAVDDTVFVLNSNLGADFSPAGPASVSVITGSPPSVVRTIELSGLNAGAAVATSDGQLVVLNSGSFGADNGSLSIVARDALAETSHVEGFGDFPGAVAVGPSGRIYIGSFNYGLAVWDPASSAFVRSPADAVEPNGIPSVSGIAFDEDERLYTLVPGADLSVQACTEPSRALRLNSEYAVELEIPTGICPFGIAFTTVP